MGFIILALGSVLADKVSHVGHILVRASKASVRYVMQVNFMSAKLRCLKDAREDRCRQAS